MHRKNPEQANKKPYLPPKVQAFQSLKEITLAITCGCAYWGDQAYSFCDDCNWSGGKQVVCPDPPEECE